MKISGIWFENLIPKYNPPSPYMRVAKNKCYLLFSTQRRVSSESSFGELSLDHFPLLTFNKLLCCVFAYQ